MLLKRKCTGLAEHCQTPELMPGWAIALTVVIPVILFATVIGYMAYRSWKRNKQEAQFDNDPDYEGEGTLLPDVSEYAMPNANPFETKGGPRYPSAAYGNRASNQPHNRLAHDLQSYILGMPRVELYVIPHQGLTGSKQLLDDFAQKMGVDHNAYDESARVSRRNSFALSLRILTGMNSSSSLPRVRDQGREDKALVRVPLSEQHPLPFSPDVSQAVTLPLDESSFNLGTVPSGYKPGYDRGYDREYDFESQPRSHMHNENDLGSREGLVKQEPWGHAVKKETLWDHEDELWSGVVKQEDPWAQDQIPESKPLPEPSQLPEPNTSHTPFDNSPAAWSQHAPQDKPIVPSNPSEVWHDAEPEPHPYSKVEGPAASEERSRVQFKEEPSDEPPLDPVEAEKLARIKSVYQVYFDRNDSVKSTALRYQPPTDHPPLPHSVQAEDYNQPLPHSIKQEDNGSGPYGAYGGEGHVPLPHVKQEDPYQLPPDQSSPEYHREFAAPQEAALKEEPLSYLMVPPGDVRLQSREYLGEEDRRRTVASSFYLEEEEEHPAEYGDLPFQKFDPATPQMAAPMAHPPPRAAMKPAQLAKLQRLPAPSEFRKLTLETFTNYEPQRSVARSAALPPVVPSPAFNGPNNLLKLGDSSLPTPAQLARTLIVMLDATTQIGAKKAYKPAGLRNASGAGGSQSMVGAPLMVSSLPWGSKPGTPTDEHFPLLPSDVAIPGSGLHRDLRTALGKGDNYQF